MGKILVLGNNNYNTWIQSVQNACYIQMPSGFSLGEYGEMELCQFVLSNFSESIDACVIDVDSIANPELCQRKTGHLLRRKSNKHAIIGTVMTMRLYPKC